MAARDLPFTAHALVAPNSFFTTGEVDGDVDGTDAILSYQSPESDDSESDFLTQAWRRRRVSGGRRSRILWLMGSEDNVPHCCKRRGGERRRFMEVFEELRRHQTFRGELEHVGRQKEAVCFAVDLLVHIEQRIIEDLSIARVPTIDISIPWLDKDRSFADESVFEDLVA